MLLVKKGYPKANTAPNCVSESEKRQAKQEGHRQIKGDNDKRKKKGERTKKGTREEKGFANIKYGKKEKSRKGLINGGEDEKL